MKHRHLAWAIRLASRMILYIIGLFLILSPPLLGADNSTNDDTSAAITSTSSNQQASGALTVAAPSPVPAKPSSSINAGWDPARYVNMWLPKWLRFSGEYRNRDETPTAYNFVPGNNDRYALSRLRLNFDATPTQWFHGFVQARDSEVIGANPKNVTSSMKDVFDLTQAYVEFRNREDGWISLKVGRQELSFGDERFIARSNWSNAGREFDAARLALQSHTYGVRVDVFASSVVKNYLTSSDAVQAGRNLYGIDTELTKIVPKATIEPYVYLKTVPKVTGVDKKTGDERLYSSGLRWAGTISGGFDYRMRYTFQSGHLADDPIHAWAGYGIFGYTLPVGRLAPRFSIEYNYASGNEAIGDHTIGTFDLLYPTTHQWNRITDRLGEENIKDLKPGFDFRPREKMRLYFYESNLWLASKYDSLYDSTGAVLVKVPKGGAPSTQIGREADLYGTYDINPRLQLGAGFGRLMAGSFLKKTTPGASVDYPYISVDYKF